MTAATASARSLAEIEATLPRLADVASQGRADRLAAQLELALKFAPPLVVDHGLRDAHTLPLVGERSAAGFRSWRESPDKAWSRQYLEIARTGNSYAVLIFDCDKPERAREAIGDGAVPIPNWKVQNPRTEHLHVAYCLETPVHRYPEAARGPLDYADRITEYFTETLSADPGFTGVLTRNPSPTGTGFGDRTEWGRKEPYSLGELAEVIPFKWTPPKIPQTSIGRNCHLHTSLLWWAGRWENSETDVMVAAMFINQHFDCPLPQNEVAATVRSVEKYRARWAARGWHKPAWLKKQAARSAKQKGKARKASVSREGSNAALCPWDAEGVSRRWWYELRRREKAAIEANTDSATRSQHR